MNRNLLAAVALVAAGALLFPTVAAPWTDDVSDSEGDDIEPSDGPNGVYAVEDENGQLALQIDGDAPTAGDVGPVRRTESPTAPMAKETLAVRVTRSPTRRSRHSPVR